MKRAAQRIAIAIRGASLAALVVAVGCPADPRDAEETKVVARVGESEIKEGQLLSVLAQRGVPRIPDLASRKVVARTILDGLVEEELLVVGAARAGINVSDDDVEQEIRSRAEGYPAGMFQRVLVAEQLTIDDLRAKVRRRMLGDAFLRARLASAAQVKDADVRARYEADVKAVVRPPAVRARQILVRTEEEAEHLVEELRLKKTTFESAAAKYSAAPEAHQGGDLGWFAAGELPQVYDLCFLLEPGQVSAVVASEFGFHIFQVVDRRTEGPEPFESARARLEADIGRERQTAAMKAVLDELKSTNPVVVNDKAVGRVVARLPKAVAEPMASAMNGRLENTAPALDSDGQTDPLKEAPKAAKNPAGAAP